MPQRGGSDRLFRKPSSLRWPFSWPPELGSRRAHPGGAVGAALALLLCPAPASWAGSPHALPPSSRPVHLFRKAGLAGERAAEKGQPGCSQTWAGGRPGGGRAPSFLVTLLGSSFFGPRGPPPRRLPPGPPACRWEKGLPWPVGPCGGGGALPSSGHCLAPPTRSAGIHRPEAGTQGSGVVGSCKPSSPWHWAKPLIFQNRPTNRSMTPASCLICRAALWSPFHSWGN